MKISKIQIKNFRLLKAVSLDMEDQLSLIIGKNNCGKTSLLLLLERFLGKGATSFSYEDLTLEVGRTLAEWVASPHAEHSQPNDINIQLTLFIEYDENDDLSRVGDTVLMDLDPNNSTIVLQFEYGADDAALDRLKQGFVDENTRRKGTKVGLISAVDFLSKEHERYFKTRRRSIRFDVNAGAPDFEHYVDLDKEKIKLDRIIRFQKIDARRDVSNKDSDRTLSTQSAREYDRIIASSGEIQEVERFKDSLVKADADLDTVYGDLFDGVLKDVAQFGGVHRNESQIKIVSSLRSNRLLKDNTVVKYASGHDGHDLPENHNGLGYLNLISMIFELRCVLQDFAGTAEIPPADINLLFVEEPEAHTHPQLQYVFIKNIKELLKRSSHPNGKCAFNLQTIISTHSTHIASESSFDDLKYLRRDGGTVQVLNLKDLAKLYSDKPSWFKFLRQYLTVHRSELFFADKAIFIEGDTERVLVPAMVTKIDQDWRIIALQTGIEPDLPLQSQNVSIVEVGNYFNTFERFVRFIGLKCLVITDLDGGRKVPALDGENNPRKNKDGTPRMRSESCKTEFASFTTNETLKQFFSLPDKPTPIQFDDLCKLPSEKKVFASNGEAWAADPKGNLRIAFQTEELNAQEKMYHARSFEDAFLHLNYDILKTACTNADGTFNKGHPFPSLTTKHLKTFILDQKPYEMAENGIGSKPSFAIEVLLHSTDTPVKVSPHKDLGLPDQTQIKMFENWNTPAYIREGLNWLKED